MKKTLTGLTIVLGLTWIGVASAQVPAEESMDEGAADESEFPLAEEEEMPAEEEAPAPAEPAATEENSEDKGESGQRSTKNGDDGMRFRFGVAGGAGPMFITYKPTGENATATYGGVDLRFGLQVNDLIGVYVQPQTGVYVLGNSGFLGTGGLLGGSLGADFTFFHRMFVGAGVGYAILNNPGGMEVHMRAGGYPLMKRSSEKVRRKGLMMGVDFRLHFVGKSGQNYTAVAPTFMLGYEAF